MRHILFIFLIIFSSYKGDSQSRDVLCKNFKLGGWGLMYNPHYKKYAIVRYDSTSCCGNELSFLAVDRWGRYGIYAEGWDKKECYECAIKSKSIFVNPCDAKAFLQSYFRWLKNDHWE